MLRVPDFLEVSDSVRIQYGGSVNDKNAADLGSLAEGCAMLRGNSNIGHRSHRQKLPPHTEDSSPTLMASLLVVLLLRAILSPPSSTLCEPDACDVESRASDMHRIP